MIRVEQVTKRYGMVEAVRGVSLSLEAGRVTGLLGPNGAGKTTLIRMLCGVFAPTSGRISVQGHDTLEAPLEARRALGYLPESAPLYPEMAVESFLKFRAGLFGLVARETGAAIERAMARCLLGAVRGRRIGTLSKGFRQRVGLAAAILHDPPVLVLDEPASGLDPSQQQEMRALIRRLGAEKLVVLSSHVLPEVEQVCDRVIIMARGRVRADGSPAELVAAQGRAAGYRVEARGVDSERAGAALGGVAGVKDVRGEGAGWVVTPGAEAGDLREALARAIGAAGGVVIELSRGAATLEQVFERVIAQSDPDEPAAAAAQRGPETRAA